jgi:LEA14-like dessication related protein
MFNNNVRNFIFLLILILIMISTGCALLSSRPQTPSVNIVEVKLKEFKMLEAVFSVQLRVINPNDFSFVVKGANCDFSINGVHLATGVTDKATEIPASGTAFFTVDIYSSVFDVVKCARSLSDKKICKYKVKGKLNLDAKNFLPLNLPFDSEGELEMKDLLGKN